MAFVDLFGDKLLTKDGEKSTVEVLTGKTAVGIYFSAHWCPPCRGFTPQLGNMYTNAFKGKGMEIVFVSSDKDDGAFSSYYGEQPWLALPYADRERKDALSKKYKVKGIPTFVILDADGRVITTDGRTAVSKDPAGNNYPWVPPTAAEKAQQMKELLGPDLISKAQGKYIGLYFSAHWCPPCRGFTPEFARMYNDGLKDKMEVIFVSSDRDESAFKEYAAEQPWLALPYAERAKKDTLSSLCSVEGIPTLVVLNPDCSILTTDGRSKVGSDPKGENLPEGWLPQPFNDVNDDPSNLNEKTCLIALGDDVAAADAVKAVAMAAYEKVGKDVESMKVAFFKGPDGGVVSQLRNLTKIASGNQIVLIDIPDDGAYYVCGEPSTEEGITKFLADFEAKKLERKQLQK